jgi:transcriptional regulator with XRE-family HTH domain
MVNPVKPTLAVLGRRIRERRQVKGWSQEELADRAKLDRSYIGGIERGERNITVLKLCQVAAALKLDLGSLMRGLLSGAAR